MPQTPDLTLRETAFLAGVSEGTIEKALQTGVLKTVAAPARFRGGAARFLPIRAVAFFHALTPDVMAGLVPAIHVSRCRGASGEGARRWPDVDTRNKSGHDDGGAAELQGRRQCRPRHGARPEVKPDTSGRTSGAN